MLQINSQLLSVQRNVKKCNACKKIKHNSEFGTHVYDKAIKANPNLIGILQMTRGDDLLPRCKKCQKKAQFNLQKFHLNQSLTNIDKMQYDLS